jgi:adenosylcobyric acid synthase
VSSAPKALDIAVIRLPRISNFTDFNALSRMSAVGLRYVESPEALKEPDLIILPGTKNTMGDLLWLRMNGLEALIRKQAAQGTPVIGVCGGYQMLGYTLDDPERVEDGGSMRGMELLPVHTVFEPAKVRTRVIGTVCSLDGIFAELSGAELTGYEIHMGKTTLQPEVVPFSTLPGDQPDGAVCKNVLGSYVHGLFDSELGTALVRMLLKSKGLNESEAEEINITEYKNRQYDLLADTLRASLDMPRIYELMGLSTTEGQGKGA